MLSTEEAELSVLGGGVGGGWRSAQPSSGMRQASRACRGLLGDAHRSTGFTSLEVYRDFEMAPQNVCVCEKMLNTIHSKQAQYKLF